MGYIKSVEHFRNYLAKVVREKNITDHFNIHFYIEKIYNKGRADQYTYALRQDANVITRNGVLKWLSLEPKQGLPLELDYMVKHSFTNEFLEYVKTLDHVAGVYSFWDNEKPLYVGFSTNLQGRVIASFDERFKEFDDQITLKVIKCTSRADAAILEIYLINKLRPAFNVTGKFCDYMTLTVKPVPEFENGIICNTPKFVGAEC